MRAYCDAPDLEAHATYKIWVSLKSMVGCRFSISKKIFLGGAFYDELTEDRYTGRITRRANVLQCTLSITWDADGLPDVYPMHRLLAPGYHLKLEAHANGSAPPELTGRALAEEQVRARREDAGGETGRPAAAQREEPPQIVDVEWTDGSVRRVQRWTVVEPEAVAVDQRKAAGHGEFPMKLKRVLPNPEPSELRTGFDFLFQWSVPPAFLSELMGFMNERLDDSTTSTRKVTKGELVRYTCLTM